MKEDTRLGKDPLSWLKNGQAGDEPGPESGGEPQAGDPEPLSAPPGGEAVLDILEGGPAPGWSPEVVLENLEDGLCVLTPEGEILYANPAFEALLDFLTQVNGAPVDPDDLLPFLDQAEGKTILEELFRSGEPQECACLFTFRDGSDVVLEETLHLGKDPRTQADFVYVFLSFPEDDGEDEDLEDACGGMEEVCLEALLSMGVTLPGEDEAEDPEGRDLAAELVAMAAEIREQTGAGYPMPELEVNVEAMDLDADMVAFVRLLLAVALRRLMAAGDKAGSTGIIRLDISPRGEAGLRLLLSYPPGTGSLKLQDKEPEVWDLARHACELWRGALAEFEAASSGLMLTLY